MKDKLEVLFVTSNPRVLTLDETLADDFCRVQVVDAGRIDSRAQAMAEGVRQASAPLVGFVGNHSYPNHDWAEKLIAAHESAWAGVGPAELNANPDSMISWSHFFMGHGRWIFPVENGVIDILPATSSVYKHPLLIDYGPELATMLERDGALPRDLKSKGYDLFLEPDAKVLHFNVSLADSFLRFRFWVGRAYGASRASREKWSPVRRALYIFGSPLIPLIHLRLILPWIRRCDREYQLLPRILPALVAGLFAHAAGEVVGYAAGMGTARQQILSFESDIDRHMTVHDREIKAGALSRNDVI
ncbi:MAG: hypothetical protein KAI97_05950 [Gemmatimonadetes bacterium]|nr:hypothetical protein [Gemmatimonadota bacterium]